jgi:hypothetical protein
MLAFEDKYIKTFVIFFYHFLVFISDFHVVILIELYV